MRQLNVYWNDMMAGTLTEMLSGKGYRFEYTPDYLTGNLPHLSLTLPKKKRAIRK